MVIESNLFQGGSYLIVAGSNLFQGESNLIVAGSNRRNGGSNKRSDGSNRRNGISGKIFRVSGRRYSVSGHGGCRVASLGGFCSGGLRPSNFFTSVDQKTKAPADGQRPPPQKKPPSPKVSAAADARA